MEIDNQIRIEEFLNSLLKNSYEPVLSSSDLANTLAIFNENAFNVKEELSFVLGAFYAE